MAYEIPLDMPGLERLISDMRELRKETGGANEAMQGLTGQTNRLAESRIERAGRMGNHEPGDAGVEKVRRLTGSGARRVYDVPRGANQALSEAEHRLEVIKETGQQDLIEDAEAKVMRLRQSKDRQDRLLSGRGKTREELIAEALFTSRIGPGGQLYPLVGKLRAAGLTDPKQIQSHMQDMGFNEAQIEKMAPMVARLASAALPTLLVGAGVAAVGAGAYYLAEASSKSSAQFRNAYYTMGGSPKTVGEAMALGGADVGSKALALAERLRQGGIGSGYAARHGIIDRGPYQVDKSSNYVKMVDLLRNEPNEERAIQIARDLGLTEELRYRDLSDRTYRRFIDSFGTGTKAEAEAEAKAEMEYTANKEILQNGWNRLVRKAGAPVARAGAEWMGGLSGDWGALWERVRHLGPFGPINSVGDAIGKYAKGERDFWGNDVQKSPKLDATEANTKELANLNRTLKEQAEMISNGGRAGAALPPGVLYQYADDKFTQAALQLGAFSVG